MAVLGLTAGLAACGGDSGNGSNTAAGPTSSRRAAKADAVAAVEKAKGPVKFISPGGPVDVRPYAGKELWVVSADLSIPFHQNIVAGFKEAATAAGVRAVAFDGKGRTTEMARGIEQAVAQEAAGIALISIDTRLVTAAIAQANAALIPVVGVLNTDARAGLDKGTAGEATIDYIGSGELLTAYAVANTDGPVNGLYADVSEFRVMGFLKQGIQDGFQRYCPTGCSIKTFDTEAADFKDQVQTKTQSELRGNPNTNWMFSAFDAQALFVVPSVTVAGFGGKVRVGSINAVAANLDFIVKRNTQVVDVGNSNNWLGWAAVDRAFRASAGDNAISEVPIRLFDADNLAGANVRNEAALFDGVDYKAEYQKLWGKA
ncbi:MAG: ABC-type sugar transport system periplasmic component-like protein [Acidimicrobiales bacterium]|nr:ABC-type sugar transport system periplasmic component-like protein [Acidimicrobiales bacterium]